MKIYMLLVLTMHGTTVNAQTITESTSNEMKYWKLRGRLIGNNNKAIYNEFMTVDY